MSNDKVTYNEQLDWFQRTKTGRGYVNQCISQCVIPKKLGPYRECSDEKFQAIRSNQMIKLYRAYTDNRYYSRTGISFKETSMDTVKDILGVEIPALESDDISFIHQLAQKHRDRGDIGAYLPDVVNELRAVKILIEYNYNVEILNSKLVDETTALDNALQMAKLKLTSRITPVNDVRYYSGTPIQENFRQLPIGKTFDPEDFLPDKDFTSTKARGIVGMLSHLLRGRGELRRTIYWRGKIKLQRKNENMESEITPLIAAETIAVLENTEITLLAKIPNKLIEALQEKADELGRKVNLDYTKSYKEQRISEEARGILTLIYRDYWCSKEEKERLNQLIEENEQKYQEELRDKYNPDKIFEQKDSVKTFNNPLIQDISSDSVSLMKVEDLKWYQKIFNKIKCLFIK